MKRIALPIVSLAVCLQLTPADAYELATHGVLTEKAYKRSALNTDPQLLKSLGIDSSKANVFGEAYYDISGNDVTQRTQYDFEKGKMPDEGRDFLTVKGWLMRGAIREDDAYREDNPQDDRDPANAKLRRPLHHFFDPVNNRPLTVAGIGLLDPDVHTAPAWGLGTTNANAFVYPGIPENGRRNHFTVLDAREAIYRALTGVRLNNDGTTIMVAPTKSERDKYWATTFRALGDIVHLLQDMAQPQHTRNDQHAGKFPETLTGHASAYEKYIEARATGVQSYTIDGQTITPTPLNYLGRSDTLPDGYPLPRFARYSDYWSTSPGSDQAPGLGLADYSNRGFFSFGTNLGKNEYRLPINDAASYQARNRARTAPHPAPGTN